jgi:hypothetical protein
MFWLANMSVSASHMRLDRPAVLLYLCIRTPASQSLLRKTLLIVTSLLVNWRQPLA